MIPRQEIRRAEVLYGSGSANPMFQALAAVFFVALGAVFGLLPIYHLLVKFNGGGGSNSDFRIPVSASMLVLVGAWLLSEVIRRRHYILVNTQLGRKKLWFSRGIAANEIEKFIQDANSRFGYSIRSYARR